MSEVMKDAEKRLIEKLQRIERCSQGRRPRESVTRRRPRGSESRKPSDAYRGPRPPSR